MQSNTMIRSALSLALTTALVSGSISAQAANYGVLEKNDWLHIYHQNQDDQGWNLNTIFNDKNYKKDQFHYIKLNNTSFPDASTPHPGYGVGHKAKLTIQDLDLATTFVTSAGYGNSSAEERNRTYEFVINNSKLSAKDSKSPLFIFEGTHSSFDNVKGNNKHIITVSNNSELNGDVQWVNYIHSTDKEQQKNANVALTLRKSTWKGNLNFQTMEGADHQGTVTLKDAAQWSGTAVNVKPTVNLEGKSTWNVTQDTHVKALSSDETSTVALQGGDLYLENGQQKMGVLSFGANRQLHLNKSENTTIDSVQSANGQYDIAFANSSQKLTVTNAPKTGHFNLIVRNGYAGEKAFEINEKNLDTLFNQVQVGTQPAALKTGTFRLAQNSLVEDKVSGSYNKENGETSFVVHHSVNENVLLPRTVDMLAATQWRQEATFLTDRLSSLRAGTLANGAWARVAGSKLELDTLNADYDYAGIELGYDHTMAFGTGALTAGIAATYTDGESDFTNGSADHTTGSVSLYGSYRFEKGSFVDLTAKFGRLENEMHLTGLQAYGKDKAWATALSANFGHTFTMDSFYVEPVINVSYTSIQDKEYQIGSINVNRDKVDSFMMGAGVTAGTKIQDLDLSARAMVRRDFTGELAATYVDSKSIKRDVVDMADTWGELGLRATYNINQSVAVSADVETAFGGDVKMPVRGSMTVRYNF